MIDLRRPLHIGQMEPIGGLHPLLRCGIPLGGGARLRRAKLAALAGVVDYRGVDVTSSRTTLPRHRRPRTPGIGVGLALLIALTASLATAASAAASSATKVVSYHGYRVHVPSAWPVYRLAHDPTTCVRFDRHAVYLGAPGSNQLCPPIAVGRTEAILVAPLSAHPAGAGASGGVALPDVTVPGAQRDGGSSLELRSASRAVLVTATWGRHPNLIRTALGVRSLGSAAVVASAARVRRARANSARAHPASGSGIPFQGLGFDACSAPSEASMSAWAVPTRPRGSTSAERTWPAPSRT